MKITIQILFAIMLYTSSIAQINFEDHIIDIANLTSEASSVTSADIDGDGDMDTLSASFDDNKIAWYENIDGQGTFGPQQIISLNAIGANTVAVTDIDNDGDIDVISASRTDNKIAWYENLNGLGNFGSQNIISSNANDVLRMSVADFDGDGDMDVVAGSRFMHWYENIDGQGTFITHVITSNAIQLYSIYVVDVDGDGDVDILHASRENNPPQENEIGWYENTDGQGTFSIHHLVSALWSANYVIAADIDNDSDVDIIASGIEGSFVWYENVDGQGNFGSQTLLSINATRVISVADINGDGYIDIIFESNVGIFWYENLDGQGNFGTEILIANNAMGLKALHWEDIDDDGDLDLLSASSGDHKIAWYEHLNGQGTFGSQQLISTLPNRPTSIFAADLNSDGYTDVLSNSWSENEVYWYKNLNDSGNFGNKRIITNQAVGGSKLYATDLDGDFDVDVLVKASGDGELAWHENLDGLGNFGPEIIISSFSGTFLVSDIDNDGDKDVIFSNSTSNNHRIWWAENVNGQGDFDVFHLITEEIRSPESMAASDLDNDGDMDLIAATSHWQSPAESKIAWFENIDGNGTFGTQQIIELSATWSMYTIQAIDLDGDGDNDVIANSAEQDEIAWYENTSGQGTFESKQIIQNNYPTLSGLAADFVTDLDGDNDLDILSASRDNNGDNRRLVYYEHLDGQGNFGEPNTIMNFGDHFPTFYPKDIDLDGNVDIAYGIYNRIGWIENLTILKIPEYQNDKLALYPNPTNGIFTVKSKASIQELAIYNRLGQLILSKTNQKNMIDISILSNGIYFLKILFENGSIETKKVVKK
jgi:hypothetical protein